LVVTWRLAAARSTHGHRHEAPRHPGPPRLVSTFLLAINGSLFVQGRAPALGAFLEQLHREVPRSIGPPVTDDYGGIRRVLQLQETNNVILVVDRLCQAYSRDLPAFSRVLLWTWADSVQDVLPLNIASVWFAGTETALAVSTPNGITTLFYISRDYDRPSRPLTVTETDTWSPSSRRWQRRASPFQRTCFTWDRNHKVGTHAPLSVVAQLPDPYVTNKKAYHEFVEGLVYPVRRLANLRWMDNHTVFWRSILDCTLSGAVGFLSGIILPPGAVQYTDFRVMTTQVVVPAGLGPHPSLLQAVTDEFSANLWCATAGALLAVAVAAALAAMATLSRPPLVALAAAPLQALAPLLAQAPPGRVAHRPLSAVWLLMSVVLAAAYQRLLLRELTALPGQISSLEQLEQSGLTVRVSDEMHVHVPFLLSDKLQSRVSYFTPPEMTSAVRSVADWRNSAVVLLLDMNSMLALSPYAKAVPQRLHMFKVGATLTSAHMMFSVGSPLREPLGLSAEQVRAHGLDLHLMRSLFSRRMKDGSPDEDEQITKPLNLVQLRPVFLLLAYFNCLATLVFILEVLSQKWFNKRAQLRC
ncbi:Ionotropic receptor 126, partial [Frankliniella occidentalis]